MKEKAENQKKNLRNSIRDTFFDRFKALWRYWFTHTNRKHCTTGKKKEDISQKKEGGKFSPTCFCCYILTIFTQKEQRRGVDTKME